VITFVCILHTENGGGRDEIIWDGFQTRADENDPWLDITYRLLKTNCRALLMSLVTSDSGVNVYASIKPINPPIVPIKIGYPGATGQIDIVMK